MYQAPSPAMQAAIARMNTAPAGSRPSAAMAPATMSVGSTGTGRPSWLHSTFRNMTLRPMGLAIGRSCPHRRCGQGGF